VKQNPVRNTAPGEKNRNQKHEGGRGRTFRDGNGTACRRKKTQKHKLSARKRKAVGRRKKRREKTFGVGGARGGKTRNKPTSRLLLRDAKSKSDWMEHGRKTASRKGETARKKGITVDHLKFGTFRKTKIRKAFFGEEHGKTEQRAARQALITCNLKSKRSFLKGGGEGKSRRQ